MADLPSLSSILQQMTPNIGSTVGKTVASVGQTVQSVQNVNTQIQKIATDINSNEFKQEFQEVKTAAEIYAGVQVTASIISAACAIVIAYVTWQRFKKGK